MSGKERRVSPRKECAIRIRFRILSNGRSGGAEGLAAHLDTRGAKHLSKPEILNGETVNLSERGILFRCQENISVGAPLEMYLTLPSELTGRRPEEVRCSARVIYVDAHADAQGRKGVGAAVEQFEPVPAASNWFN